MPVTLLDKLLTAPQYALPHHLLSGWMHKLTRCQLRAWKDWQIQTFIRSYGVDMSIAEQADAYQFASFNAFFTRALRADARPIVDGVDDIVCPVDGSVSQAGSITETQIFQAKGHHFDLQQLLGGSVERAAPFVNGEFATLYLSPRDYHRIHMPLSGTLLEMIYVPGQLFSVNTRTAKVVPGLFARNERLVCIFATEIGLMALVLVGALFVGSMETVWAGTVTPPYGKKIMEWDYAGETALSLPRGAEMGRFNMGSTVVLLFERGRMERDAAISADAKVKMGQRLGKYKMA